MWVCVGNGQGPHPTDGGGGGLWIDVWASLPSPVASRDPQRAGPGTGASIPSALWRTPQQTSGKAVAEKARSPGWCGSVD